MCEPDFANTLRSLPLSFSLFPSLFLSRAKRRVNVRARTKAEIPRLCLSPWDGEYAEEN